MGKPTILRRLIRGGIKSSPIIDPVPEAEYEQGELNQLTELIKTKKFNPKKYSQSHNLDIATKTFKVGQYNIEATRANTQQEDMGGLSFENFSRLVQFERWQIKILDFRGALVSNRVIMVPKSGDTESLLYSQVLAILPNQAIS
jgi:poly-beta-hydroxyalkanoate depolymerase